jgi:hypothetical protein
MVETNRGCCFLFALVAFVLPLEARAQTQDMPGRPPPIRETVRNYVRFLYVLATPIDTKVFHGKELTFRRALELLREEMTKKDLDLLLFVNRESFEEAKPGNEIYKVPIKISLPGKQAAGTILRQILDQIPGKDAAVLIGYGYIEITHKHGVSLASWLRQFTDPPMGGLIGAKQKRVE